MYVYWVGMNHEFLIDFRCLFETIPILTQNLKLDGIKTNSIYDADPWWHKMYIKMVC